MISQEEGNPERTKIEENYTDDFEGEQNQAGKQMLMEPKYSHNYRQSEHKIKAQDLSILPAIPLKAAKSTSQFNERGRNHHSFGRSKLATIISHHANMRNLRQKQKSELPCSPMNRGVQENKLYLKNNYNHIKPRVNEHFKKHAGKTHLPSLNTVSAITELQSARILDDYRIISHVGKGSFSVVSAAVNKNTNCKFAIKTYARIDQMEEVKIKSIQAEVQNLFDLQHDNIISLSHAVRDGRKIQLIMENGGQQSLSGLLRKFKTFPEDHAKKYFAQIAEALAYCHSKNICHRDLKLENILVDDEGKVKLIDFGFSVKCISKAKLITFCGTPPYMSPELAAKTPYNGMCSDIWALGVSLYLMLTGKFPFKASNQNELYRLIQQGKYQLKSEISGQAKQLLSNMLQVSEGNRYTASQVLESEWLRS